MLCSASVVGVCAHDRETLLRLTWERDGKNVSQACSTEPRLSSQIQWKKLEQTRNIPSSQNEEDPSVIDIGEKVVSHLLRRKSAFDGVLTEVKAKSRGGGFTVTAAQGKGWNHVLRTNEASLLNSLIRLVKKNTVRLTENPGGADSPKKDSVSTAKESRINPTRHFGVRH